MGWILSGREDRDDKKSKKTANTQNPLKKNNDGTWLPTGRKKEEISDSEHPN